MLALEPRRLSRTKTLIPVSVRQVTYIVFHYVTGVPFDLANNSGVYDRLTLWEQIDYGAQYTPAKKWLTTLPIVLSVMPPASPLSLPA